MRQTASMLALMPRLTVSDEQRAALESWTRSRTLSHRQGLRARIILLGAEGLSSRATAARLGCARQTVVMWRQRFIEAGLAGLEEQPGRGRPRQLTDAKVNRILALSMKPPAGATQWSIRTLAAKVGVSHSTVQRIWKLHGLQPHRSRGFKYSTDPELEEKVTDVVGLYLHPPENAVVLCVDEKSQIQALDRTQPLLPMKPHQVERRTHDYKRHGTTTLFAALDLATGQVTGRCYDRHRKEDFLAFLRLLDVRYPSQDLHLVLDNYHTHKHAEVQAWLDAHPRVSLHFTPTSASWLNQVETWFSILQRRTIRRGTFTSVTALKQAIRRFLEAWNANSKPFAWVKTADELLAGPGLRSSESLH